MFTKYTPSIIITTCLVLTSCQSSTTKQDNIDTKNASINTAPKITAKNFSNKLSTAIAVLLENNSNEPFSQKAAHLALTNSKLMLDIQTTNLQMQHQQEVENTGVTVVGFYPKHQRISAYTDSIESLQKLQLLPFIRYIQEETGMTNKDLK